MTMDRKRGGPAPTDAMPKGWVEIPFDIAADTHPVTRLEDLEGQERADAEAALADLAADRDRQGLVPANPLDVKSGVKPRRKPDG